MRKKAVFFDADGTVCDIEKGVPESAIRAIQAMRHGSVPEEAGHLYRLIWNRYLLRG